ncbi:MAG: DUF3362 domain-containing protein [Gemmataceae bacterium]|nr:DUF3362 domain-containing protein [Gemmataceae bacterium]
MQSDKPFDIATCMYRTGVDPFTGKTVRTAGSLGDRELPRALMPFFKPENGFEVREALAKPGRTNPVGGCDGLIPADPPQEAVRARRGRADATARADYDHSVANPAAGGAAGERPDPSLTKTAGDRPGRKS